MTQEIKNKVVVITGASSGNGAATARRLAEHGARLVLGARRLDRLRHWHAELVLGEEGRRQTDVTQYPQVVHLVDHAVRAPRADRRDPQLTRASCRTRRSSGARWRTGSTRSM